MLATLTDVAKRSREVLCLGRYLSALGRLLRLLLLADQGLVDVRDYTSSGDCCSDQCIQLFVTPADNSYLV